MSKNVAIIGGGLGGLATACYLAKDGYKVTVYEKNDQFGGRAMSFTHKGFHFDMGPSWYWMPHLFEKFFSDFGKKTSDYYTLQRLDPSYRVFFSPDEHYDIPADLSKFYDLIETIEKGSSKKLQKILANGSLMLRTSEGKFLYRDYPSIFSMFVPELVVDGIKTRAYVPLGTLIKQNFHDQRLQKLLTWHSLFLGASPENLPSIYSFILNVDFEQGTWYPAGGIHKIIDATIDLATELGVELRPSSETNSLKVLDGKVIEATTKAGETINADIFIANADYHHVETELLDSKWQTIPEKNWERKTLSPSTMLFYIGLDTKLGNSLHHNYYFSLDTWNEHFQTLFNKKQQNWPTGIPSYYFHATAKTDPATAPAGGESVFVLIPVAYGLDDSEQIREDMFNRIIEHMEKLTQTEIKKHIVYKKIHAHKEQKAIYNAYQGNNFGLAQTLFQTGAFRPYNRSRKVNNLYYVGHYTHPGIGLPMVLISGKVTADLVKQHEQH